MTEQSNSNQPKAQQSKLGVITALLADTQAALDGALAELQRAGVVIYELRKENEQLRHDESTARADLDAARAQLDEVER